MLYGLTYMWNLDKILKELMESGQNDGCQDLQGGILVQTYKEFIMLYCMLAKVEVPCGSNGKASAYNEGDPGLIDHWVGKFPWRRK